MSSRTRQDRFLATVCLSVVILVCGIGSSVAAQEAQHTGDWITINKDYSSQRYVDLEQIKPENVGTLKEVCETQLNEPSWFSSGVLMVARTLYVTTLRATYAIDAATCELRWRNILELGRTASDRNRGPGCAGFRRKDIRLPGHTHRGYACLLPASSPRSLCRYPAAFQQGACPGTVCMNSWYRPGCI